MGGDTATPDHDLDDDGHDDVAAGGDGCDDNTGSLGWGGVSTNRRLGAMNRAAPSPSR